MTPAMLVTFEAFTRYYAEHGVPPSYRELARLTGRKSVHGVHDHVQRLIISGDLVRTGDGWRSVAPANKERDLSKVPTAQLRAEIKRREKSGG